MDQEQFIEHMNENWLPGMPLPDGWRCERRCPSKGEAYQDEHSFRLAYNHFQHNKYFVFTPTTQTVTVELELPEGYRVVGYRHPKEGEKFLYPDGDIATANFDFSKEKFFVLESTK